MSKIKYGFFVLILISYSCRCAELPFSNTENFIRHNLIGYLANDTKIAIVGTRNNLGKESFFLVKANEPNEVVYTGIIQTDRGNDNTPFLYNFTCDFSDLTTQGRYQLRLEDGTISRPFVIGGLKEYQEALSLVLQFFHAQRCGDTDPILHKPCHLHDKNAAIDVSGGWHDAGDYIKFMITTTFAALELLTAADYAVSYDFADAMGDTLPRNGIPDILDEARIGLDWILKMTSGYADGKYYYQVSGAEDHSGWRLPETDDSGRDAGKSRSSHQGWGGNLLGRSSACLAIAARMYGPYDETFASVCLNRAEALFAKNNQYENVQKSDPVEYYNERSWRDDMILGSAELYQTTQKKDYLAYAKSNLEKLNGNSLGWNNADFLAYAACYKANIEREMTRKKMMDGLDIALQKSNHDVFFLSSHYVWGTTALFTGNAQKAIMFYYLTSDPIYLDLATSQRDYLLGRNNWGICFVIGLGPVYPVNAHSQLNSLAGLHKGAVVGGPAELESWRKVFPTLKIENDTYSQFQSNIIYYDNRSDYYTNEVALDYTAPSVFIFLHQVAEAMHQ